MLILVCLVVFFMRSADSQSGLVIEDDLRKFFGTLEPYVSGRNDIVFVLDASGSITSANFPHEVKFTELISRKFTVSSDFTRVAVISYSNVVKTPIDYIKNSDKNNMCTFLKDLKTVPYTGRNTNTAGALKGAGNILKNARPNSKKIVLLISDGKSSSEYGLPVPVAQKLKSSGYILFAVGVASINKDELLAIASSPNHIYMLKNFKYIVQINDQLRNDTKEVVWDAAESELCNSYCSAGQDCCDANAACFCGTRGGRYECACRAGYQGNGHKGECKKCQVGSYKEGSGKDLCVSCPANSTTAAEASTSRKQCVCITGHVGKPEKGEACKPVTCDKLTSPVGGQIFPTHCGNTYQAVCTFSCHPGYCPYACNTSAIGLSGGSSAKPVEPRKCLESRFWSGAEFFCDKVKCPALDAPANGNYKCNSTDFGFFTRCNFTCGDGHTMTGSTHRSCLMDGTWTGTETICKVNTCPRLKINKYLKVKPGHCSSKEKPFRTTCQYYCVDGYQLQTSGGQTNNVGIRNCLANGTWLNFHEKITCKDVSPPTMVCPSDISVSNDKLKSTALVTWKQPTVKDNSWIDKVRIIHPTDIKELAHHFPLGRTKVTYKATDGVGLSSVCSFTVEVRDVEPPQVQNCPGDIETFYHKRTGTPVTWTEPSFVDNSGKIKTFYQNRKPGQKFTWGPPAEVIYNATDYSQNAASCRFMVKVKQYKCPYHPPPTYGSLTCDTWVEGQFCSVACQSGHKFARKPEKVYYCFQRRGFGEWGPLLGPMFGSTKFEFPWPDCAKEESISGVKLGLKSQYYVGSCPDSEEVRNQIAQNFIDILNKEFFVLGICEPSDGCNIQNVNITCSSNGNQRSKRDTLRSNVLSVDYSIVLKPTFIKQTKNVSTNATITPEEEIDNFISNKVDKIRRAKVPDLKSNGLAAISTKNNVQITEKPKIFCNLGSILLNARCLQCPVGTYHDPITDTCIDCPTNQYQDIPGSEYCRSCGSGRTTLTTNSKSKDDCRSTCLPGTYSSTGLSSCSSCPIGTYQDQVGQMGCIPCLDGLTTWKIGSYSVENCTWMCKEGTYSDTGFYPCLVCPRGWYQPHKGQTKCLQCKKGLTTINEGTHLEQLCQDVDLCKKLSPCQNGGSCTRNGTDYSCKCPVGYIGRNCEVNDNDCFTGVCLNNGTCIDRINSYYCWCSPGFSGKNCEVNVDDCLSDPCINGGICIDKTLDFSCRCPVGFSGKQCEINFDDCASDPCLNGGECTDLDNDFMCCCPEGFVGKQCSERLDPCKINNCQNNGKCLARGFANYTCQCPGGFHGYFCEQEIDECVSNPCLNGAECVDGINSFRCRCKPGYNGTLCEAVLNSDFDVKFVGSYTSNYVKIENTLNLDAVTVIFWMKTSDKSARGTPLSYSYKDNNGKIEENALTFADYNKFLVSLHGEVIRTAIIGNKDTNWHSYCLTWDGHDGSWAIYVDGNKVNSGTKLKKGGKLWNGYFVLGQEQDALGGAFSPTEAFIGSIGQFNVWNYAMAANDIKVISNKCGLYGNIIAWPDVLLNVHGDADVTGASQLCKAVQKCSDSDCHCSTNKDADICWKKLGSCSPNPCQGKSRCISTKDKNLICNCQKGLKGKFCQYDIDECAENIHNCSHGCVNKPGYYVCTCPQGYTLDADKHTCKDTSYCKFNGNYHLNGDSWNDGCKNCKCKDGLVSCEKIQCPRTKCSQGQKLVSLPGNCCPECTPEPAFCVVTKDNMYTTFDGLIFWFVGDCRYVLAQDCGGADYKIFSEVDKSNLMSRQYYIKVKCQVVRVNSRSIQVGGKFVTASYGDEHLSITHDASKSTVVTLYNGIRVAVTKDGDITINAPHSLKTKTCGLCGNYNGNQNDDKMTQQRLPARSVLEFAHSWKVDGYRYCKQNRPVLNFSAFYPRLYMSGVCRNLPLKKQLEIRKTCSVLKSFTFRYCYAKVKPTEYYRRCLQDACMCGFNEPCFCDSIAAYVNECHRRHIDIKEWKQKSMCEMRCTGGRVFDSCGPPCHQTCTDLIGNHCSQTECSPGCYCPAGMVLHQNSCIFRHRCPKYSANMIPLRK